jgi:hypothetical protein
MGFAAGYEVLQAALGPTVVGLVHLMFTHGHALPVFK